MSIVKWIISVLSCLFFIGLIYLIRIVIKNKDKTERNKEIIGAVLTGIGFATSVILVFVMKPAPPAISPIGKNISEPILIELSSTENLTIHFTLDGSLPSKHSKVYVEPFTIDSEITVAAITVDYFGVSDISRESYRLEPQIKSSIEPLQESPNDSDNSKFTKDYRTGHENDYGNTEYFNRQALLCRQDEMFYISDKNAIYKTKDFISFVHVIDGTIVQNICVLGDWIYYTSDKLICKVRTDGKQSETILETSRGVIRMNAKGDWLYFVSNENGLLYKIIKNGEALTQLTEIPVSNFVIIRDYLYFTSGDFEKTYETGHSMSTRGFYKLHLFTNEITKIVLPEYLGYELTPNEMHYYNGVFYINANGIRVFDVETEVLTLIDDRSVFDTCIFDGRLYYIYPLEDKYESFWYYDITSKEHVFVATPYENENRINLFYPTNYGIIYSHEFANWSIVGINGLDKHFLNIERE